MLGLFPHLPVQMSPALETKQANARYHNSVQSLGLPGPKGLRPRYAPIPAPAVPEFIGPLDLRTVMVRRWSKGDKFNGRKLSGKAENVDCFKGKTARALRLGEAAREMAGTVDPVQIGIGGVK